jgi:hypothetical protein
MRSCDAEPSSTTGVWSWCCRCGDGTTKYVGALSYASLSGQENMLFQTTSNGKHTAELSRRSVVRRQPRVVLSLGGDDIAGKTSKPILKLSGIHRTQHHISTRGVLLIYSISFFK